MSYTPKVNDYVIWDKGEYGIDEGWVYFYSDEYITIETSIKPRPDCEKEGSLHQFIHTFGTLIVDIITVWEFITL